MKITPNVMTTTPFLFDVSRKKADGVFERYTRGPIEMGVDLDDQVCCWDRVVE
jgi:hypothetical protein